MARVATKLVVEIEVAANPVDEITTVMMAVLSHHREHEESVLVALSERIQKRLAHMRKEAESNAG